MCVGSQAGMAAGAKVGMLLIHKNEMLETPMSQTIEASMPTIPCGAIVGNRERGLFSLLKVEHPTKLRSWNACRKDEGILAEMSPLS